MISTVYAHRPWVAALVAGTVAACSTWVSVEISFVVRAAVDRALRERVFGARKGVVVVAQFAIRRSEGMVGDPAVLRHASLNS